MRPDDEPPAEERDRSSDGPLDRDATRPLPRQPHPAAGEADREADRETVQEEPEPYGRALNAGDLFQLGGEPSDYELIEEIGRGGMSTVWRARQLSLDRTVAVKLLIPQFALSMESVARFQREARAGGRLNHPGIVRTYATGLRSGIPFIVQELVTGGRTLLHAIRERAELATLPEGHDRWVAGITAKVARALEYAHDRQVIHRDVKPGNILLEENDEPRIADFGLALLEDDASLSRTGQVIGTVLYMSPEQVRPTSEGVDHRADVFGLGATLFEALTLHSPFGTQADGQLLARLESRRARDPRDMRPDMPESLARICVKALSPRREDRYADMAKFAEDLDRYLAGRPVLARPAPRPATLRVFGMGRGPLALAGLLLAISALALGSLLSMEWFWHSGPNEESGSEIGIPDPSTTAPIPTAGEYRAAVAALQATDEESGLETVRGYSNRVLFRMASPNTRLVYALEDRVVRLLDLFRDDWPPVVPRSFPLVRIVDPSSPPLAGRACRFDFEANELFVADDGSAFSKVSTGLLARELFPLYLRAHHGEVQPHPWFLQGFDAYYDGAVILPGGGAGVPALAPDDALRVAVEQLALAEGLPTLAVLLGATSQVAPEDPAAFRAVARSLAAFLVSDNTGQAEGRWALHQYVAALETEFEDRLSSAGIVAAKDLSAVEVWDAQRAAYAASWARADLSSLGQRWREAISSGR